MFWLAITPILIILILMVGLRWGASRAGAAGYLTALAVAVVFFGLNLETLAYAHAKALLLIINVLLIIWTAFLLFRVAEEAGAIRLIGESLPHLTTDRGMQALIIGWVFASFLQGTGGFGVPVAVIAPLLVGLGFSPLAAVVVPSIGHSWAITFGSMGSSFNALMLATGYGWEELAAPSAIFLGTVGLGVGLMVAHAAGGWIALRRLWGGILLLGGAMSVGQYLTATAGLWNIGAFVGSLIGLVVGFPLARYYKGDADKERSNLDWKALLTALSGYGVLVVLTLSVQLIPVVHDALGRFRIGLNFPQLETSLGYITPAGPGREIPLFRHAGTILLVSALIAYFIYQRAGWYKNGAFRRIVSGTLKRVITSSVGITAMVSMAVIMQHAGMTDALAQGLSTAVGRAFPALAPWMGALGAFMTGSNTNSNVIFAALQMRTAQLLGFPVVIILAAQTAGGALGSVIAPTKIVVGASTGGMAGREGEIMRKMLVYIGILILLVSLLATLGVLI